jgi:putative heme-binding domain-containing protein
MKARAPFLSLAVAFAAGMMAVAQSADKNDSVAELASFKLADGFEANLFASEKDGILKPIQMRWDERGRLWVIGSKTYPQVRPDEEPDDKVWILEDTNGDGKADKTTVFADGLMIPTGIEIAPVRKTTEHAEQKTDPGASGTSVPSAPSAAYIGEGTKLWLMTDTDGDGKADQREIVLRGFGTGDNHQNINSFRWSPGGELMFCQGLHSFSRVETPHGIVQLSEAGLWRWRPNENRLDAFFGGKADPQNPWGWVWTRFGQPLVAAGNNGTYFCPLPEMIRGWQEGRRDNIWVKGNSRKTSGPVFVQNPHFPDEWQDVLVAGGYINNAVWSLKVEDDGAGFRIVDHPTLPPLVQSTHGSFRPVDVKFGPDGALYVCDWYNPIIGHYQASFRHPERDKQHGRIWRITAKGRPLLKAPRISGAPVADLVQLLKSDSDAVRYHVRRELAGRDRNEVARTLGDWWERLDPNDPTTEHALFEALCVYEWIGKVEPVLAGKLCKAKNPDLRAYAAGVLARWSDALPREFDVAAALVELAHDENPRVRLAAVVAGGNIPSLASTVVVVSAATKPRDKFIDIALGAAAAVLRPYWEPYVAKGAPDWKPEWRDAIQALKPKDGHVVGTRLSSPSSNVVTLPPAVPAPKNIPAEFITTLAREVREKGEIRRGAEVYRRAELMCVSCHKIGDQGGQLGPSLDAIGSAQPLDFIIGAVLDPQREIKEGFETWEITTRDGKVRAGLIVAGGSSEITVRDATGSEERIPMSQVASRKLIGSLMVPGLTDRLSREELRDLFAYLSQLGKAGN